MVGINVGVPATMAMFPFTGWDASFFGDLHIQGREAVQFYTQQKVDHHAAGSAAPSGTSGGNNAAMALLIKNGEIVTADSRYEGRHLLRGRDDHADRRAPRGARRAREVVDAAGKYVFPGFIDPHVHITLPFMGTLAKDTYETGSRAALVGGTTTLIEMCCPARGRRRPRGVRALDGAGRRPVGVRLHLPHGRDPVRRRDRVRSCARSSGAGSAPSRSSSPTRAPSGSTTRELYQTLKLARELGVIVTAHCENETLVRGAPEGAARRRPDRSRPAPRKPAARRSRPRASTT